MSDNSDDSDGDSDDYSYEESVEDDAQDADAEDETGEELAATAAEHDALSMISGTRGENELEPEKLLHHPRPTGPEDEDGLTTDDELDWEPPAVRKRKVCGLLAWHVLIPTDICLYLQGRSRTEGTVGWHGV